MSLESAPVRKAVFAFKAAEKTIDFMDTAAAMSARGDQAKARAVLEAVAAFAGEPMDALREWHDELVMASDGPFALYDATGKPSWHDSAHDAVAGIWLRVQLLLAGGWTPADVPAAVRFDASRLAAGLRRERVKLFRARTPKVSGDDDEPTIWYHGAKAYSARGDVPVNVGNDVHKVLQQFLDRDIALNTPTLQNAGVSNPAVAINKIEELFGPEPVVRPRDRGNGRGKGLGYRIRVRSAPLKN